MSQLLEQGVERISAGVSTAKSRILQVDQLGFSRFERGVYRIQKAIAEGPGSALGLYSTDVLREGDPRVRIDRDTLRSLGFEDMKIFQAVEPEDRHYFPSHQALISGILSTAEATNATLVERQEEANVIFMAGSDREELPGMKRFRKNYDQRFNGVAITPALKYTEPALDKDGMLTRLGHSTTKYVTVPKVKNGDYIGYWIGSMEGAITEVDVQSGYLEMTDRLNAMAVVEYVTDNTSEYYVPEDQVASNEARDDVRKLCSMLYKIGFMPTMDLSKYLPTHGNPELAQEVMIRYLRQNGLSEGNASRWDKTNKKMEITASGENKSALKEGQVLHVLRFADDFSGVVIGSTKTETPRASVESFSNLGVYFTSIGIAAGMITGENLAETVNFLKDPSAVEYARQHFDPQYTMQLHFHAQARAWRDFVEVYGSNANIAMYGDANSSCGTRPEAYNVIEMAGRGMKENPGKILLLEMPRHGVEVVVPDGISVEEVIHILNPRRKIPDVIFGPPNMESLVDQIAA